MSIAPHMARTNDGHTHWPRAAPIAVIDETRATRRRRKMRYPPLLIAIFLVFTLKPFADHFGSLALPASSLFLLLILLTVIYAFRHRGAFVVCLGVLAASTVTLRFIGDHWRAPVLLMASHGLSFIIMFMVMIAILSEVLRAQTVTSDLELEQCAFTSSSVWPGLFSTIGFISSLLARSSPRRLPLI